MERAPFRSEQVVRLTDTPPTPITESTLSRNESLLLDFLRKRADDALTASDVVRLSPLGDDDARQTLSRLIAIGMLELGAATSPGADNTGSLLSPASTPSRLGRFEVDGVLGRGSMGAVLLARDPAIERVVAIKLIQTAAHLTPSQRKRYHERFYREASAAGQLHHPRIATVFDVGHGEDRTPFIVMEYVKGKTLREVLDSERLTLEQTLRIAADVLEALGYAHSQGIVHRDVKPGNIIIGADYHAKIMDFGIAHVVGSELTAGNDVLGSPYYMAPEQLSKGAIDARTDLFSFAVVLYRMLTGELPFTGDSFAAIAHAILHERPRPVSRNAPSVPPAVEEAVTLGLKKNPADRFDSAFEFRRALGVGGAGAVPAAIKRRVATDRWLPVALALVIGALLVFRLATSGSVATPERSAPAGEDTGLEMGPDAPGPSAEPTDPVETPSTILEPELPPTPPPVAPAPAPRPPAPQPRRAEPRPEPVSSPPRAPEVDASAAAPESPPRSVEAELFYEARRALESGKLQESRVALERLLEIDPSFAGAADLLVEVRDQIWQTRLPLDFRARHDHRLGGCDGELSLAALGVRFQSDAHEWAWSIDEIRVLEHPDDETIVLETFETDPLLFGKNKRYKFELERPLETSDWQRYERLLH